VYPWGRARHVPDSPGILPGATDRLVGRERELAAARLLLFAAEGRILTLTGTGGIGKTRLAIAICGERADVYADGGWFVELAALTDRSQSPSATFRQGHLALLKRWYYRPEARRSGEIFFPDTDGRWPVKAMLRGVGRVAAKMLAVGGRTE